MNNSQTPHIPHLLPAGIFFLCVFLIAVAGYATFENIKASEIEDTNKTLVSVGQLKTVRIQSYLAERKSDAAVVASFLTTPSAQYWLTHQGGDAPDILNQLAGSVTKMYQYRGLLLLDAEANIRLNTGHSGTLTEAGKTIALRAMRERSPASSKIYFGDPATPDEPVLDTFVPVMNPDGTMAVGMVVLRNELNFLFELLQTWPIESETAETLLITKDGGDVLFLNELRHQKGTAARLRVPLNTDPQSPAWPAVSAVTGHFGLLEANDYRGKRVLAYTLAVPGTPWSMVAKMDIEEAVAHSHRLLRVARIVAVILIVFAGIIVWLWWRKDQIDRFANQQLHESETRYRRLHESMMDAFVMLDMSGRLLDFNRTFLEMLGYSAEELLRQTYVDLTPEKWHEIEARIIEEQVIAHGYSQVYEKEYIRQDGTVFPVELKAFLLRDKNNQPEAMWAIVRDITERKLAEKMLRFHSEILLHLSEGILLVRASDGGIVFASPQFERMFGYEPGELFDKHVSIVNAPGEGNPEAVVAAIMNELARSGGWSGEVKNVRKDGTTFWCHASVSTFDHPQFGQVWVAVHNDITERRKTELLMQQFGSLLQGSFNEIYMFDADSLHFLLASEGAEKNLGYSTGELNQFTPLDINPLFTREGYERLIAPLRTGEQPFLLFETVHRRKDGTTYPVEVRLQLMPGDSLVFLAIIQDVTERKQAEELLHKSAEEIEDLYNHAPCGYHSLDKDGVILMINDTELVWLGYTRDEVIGKMKWPDLLTSTGLQTFLKTFPQLKEQGFASNIETGIIRKNGTVFTGLINATAIYDTDGNYVMSRSTVTDITERKRTEEVLRGHQIEIEMQNDELQRTQVYLDVARARYFDLYNLAPVGYFTISETWLIMESNLTAATLLGVDRMALTKRKFSQFIIKEDQDGCYLFRKQLDKSSKSQACELRMMKDDGTKFWAHLAGATAQDENGAPIFRIVMSDITERKRVEQQLRDLSAHLQTVREEEKAGIAREIHDDLGGTLTALKMETHKLEAELSQDKNALPLLVEHVESMSQLINAAAGITRRIITDLRPTILDDLGLLAAIEWQAAQFHKRTGIEYLVNCIEDKGNLDKLHAIALFRILQEALTNVTRHSGASRVEIEFHHSDEEVVLSISDNGRGLSDDRPVKSGSYGMLGMIERVEQLGGTIRFDTPRGGGLCITVIFPLPVPLPAKEWSI